MVSSDVTIIGAGIFGLTAAIDLNSRGYKVNVLDHGPIPYPLAASTDISKVVRIDYGPDEEYMILGERACEGWRRWNIELGQIVYHEIGVVLLTRSPFQPRGFEYESYNLLLKRGHKPDRLDRQSIANRFLAVNPDNYVDGYFNPVGGYVESGKVISLLANKAKREGVKIQEEVTITEIYKNRNRVTGIRTQTNDVINIEILIVAAGAWTPILVPDVADSFTIRGLPVFHMKVDDQKMFSPPGFPVFLADTASTGFYGFPVHPSEGVLKIGYHGQGRILHPYKDERVVIQEDFDRLFIFLADTFPSLLNSPIVHTRCCLYCDTFDEHFWIDSHPENENLFIASGGSGHAFKFGPVLGEIIADKVEGKNNPYSQKFKWRKPLPGSQGEEAARYRLQE